jgi:hypothetical protein
MMLTKIRNKRVSNVAFPIFFNSYVMAIRNERGPAQLFLMSPGECSEKERGGEDASEQGGDHCQQCVLPPLSGSDFSQEG